MNDGKVIRLAVPALTEERRKELVKVVRKMAEEGRVTIRNIRRDANEALKKLEKNKQLSEDGVHKGMDQIQDLTNRMIKSLDELLEKKEKEIMEF
jgi:ribosome recycling factor